MAACTVEWLAEAAASGGRSAVENLIESTTVYDKWVAHPSHPQTPVNPELAYYNKVRGLPGWVTNVITAESRTHALACKCTTPAHCPCVSLMHLRTARALPTPSRRAGAKACDGPRPSQNVR